MDLLAPLFNTIFDVHPLHTPTTHFPIALTGAAWLFLILALWRRSEALERAAFYNITLAAISTIVAGITGVRDNLVRFEGDEPLAGIKIFLAVTLLLVTSVAAISRWRRPEILWTPTTMVLYLSAFTASFMLATVLGFIGGVILYGF